MFAVDLGEAETSQWVNPNEVSTSTGIAKLLVQHLSHKEIKGVQSIQRMLQDALIYDAFHGSIILLIFVKLCCSCIDTVLY